MFLCILLIEYFLNPSPTEAHDDIKFEMHKTVFGQNVLHIQLGMGIVKVLTVLLLLSILLIGPVL